MTKVIVVERYVMNDSLSQNGILIVSVPDHCLSFYFISNNVSRVKRICVFEHSVMTKFNCVCPAIQRGQESWFLSEGSS